MDNLQTLVKDYLEFCSTQKCLDGKTLKAYRIDLRQFSEQICTTKVSEINSAILEKYIAMLHQDYQPKTAKRKIASLKAFFHFLEYKDLIKQNPFNRLQLHFREPVKLPKKYTPMLQLQSKETFCYPNIRGKILSYSDILSNPPAKLLVDCFFDG